MEAAEKEALTFSVRPATWGPDADSWLSRCVGHGRVTLGDLRAQFVAGADLFTIHDQAGRCCGAYLLRVDDTARGAEGVIVAAAAESDGVDMLAAFLPDIERRFRNCVGVRFHSVRHGLLKKMMRHGYAPDEYVAYKALKP